ncbi:hypothetical protein Tco_0429307 [Tanacetum coccineum]
MGMDTIQLENAVSTISQVYLLEFTSECGIPEGLHPELPGPEDTIMDFLEGKVLRGNDPVISLPNMCSDHEAAKARNLVESQETGISTFFSIMDGSPWGYVPATNGAMTQQFAALDTQGHVPRTS